MSWRRTILNVVASVEPAAAFERLAFPLNPGVEGQVVTNQKTSDVGQEIMGLPARLQVGLTALSQRG